jgi:5-methylcytosine-specific restriction endonuclease McrA
MPYKDIEKQREYQRLRQQKNTLKYRQIVVAMFGGECKRCKYDENIFAFQIDHVTPLLRSIEERNGGTNTVWRDLATGKLSIEGLQMLCANCHAIKTYEEDRKLFKFVGRPTK